MTDKLLILAADIILVIHVMFVGFVVLGLFSIYIGLVMHWQWVRNRLFRVLHLLAIAFVVIQSWLGMICPLTIWEMELRRSADVDTYSGAFIQYWLHKLLYYSAPDWVFILIYTVFGSLVLASWFVVRPRRWRI